MAAPPNRHKISTTVAPETYAALERMVKTGRAATLAEAVDLAVAEVLREENRRRLEQDTAAQFAALSPEAVAEETKLGGELGELADEVNFDE